VSDPKELELNTILEAPPAPETPVTAVDGAIFTGDTVALVMAKFAVIEQFLQLLTRDCSFNDFTREVLLSIMKVVKSEAGSILELDYRHSTIFFRAIVGQSSDRLTGFVIPLGQGIVGYVAESRQPLVVSNLEENKHHLKSIEKAVGFETRNLVAVPIIVRGRVYGVLELLNRVGEPDYTAVDVELLKYLCEMAAKAIEVRMMLAWSRSQGQAGGAAAGDAA
jgi:GAF domain-containing protein